MTVTVFVFKGSVIRQSQAVLIRLGGTVVRYDGVVPTKSRLTLRATDVH